MTLDTATVASGKGGEKGGEKEKREEKDEEKGGERGGEKEDGRRMTMLADMFLCCHSD